MATGREGGLLRWQWALYRDNHTTRKNLIVHALTVPWFWTGTLAVLTSPWSGWRAAVTGLLAMALAMFLQGRMHRAEPTPPVPFEGPIDVVRRIFAEQWITFPRFVFSGEFTRAWRATDG